MEFAQVKFRSLHGDPHVELGGIAAYKYDHLVGVICGCCGGWHKAKDVYIIEEYDEWINFGSAIVDIHDDDEWEEE